MVAQPCALDEVGVMLNIADVVCSVAVVANVVFSAVYFTTAVIVEVSVVVVFVLCDERTRGAGQMKRLKNFKEIW